MDCEWGLGWIQELYSHHVRKINLTMRHIYAPGFIHRLSGMTTDSPSLSRRPPQRRKARIMSSDATRSAPGTHGSCATRP